jgi:hypothetical protein
VKEMGKAFVDNALKASTSPPIVPPRMGTDSGSQIEEDFLTYLCITHISGPKLEGILSKVEKDRRLLNVET